MTFHVARVARYNTRGRSPCIVARGREKEIRQEKYLAFASRRASFPIVARARADGNQPEKLYTPNGVTRTKGRVGGCVCGSGPRALAGIMRLHPAALPGIGNFNF